MPELPKGIVYYIDYKFRDQEVGVIIGRFQTPELHAGHKFLIAQTFLKFDRVIICLGCVPIKDSNRNQLSFDVRKVMVKSYIDSISEVIDTSKLVDIIPVYDNPSDVLWAEQLDNLAIDTVKNKLSNEFTYKYHLVAGKDNCFNSYKKGGMFQTVEMTRNDLNDLHGTTTREKAKTEILDCPNWRMGIIYGKNDLFPKVYPCVDIAIFNPVNNELLLGRKPGEKYFRFPGGFVDPTDSSYEMAAKREAIEECGNIELDDFQYINSTLINDWRYRNETNKIMTTFFMCQYIYGSPQANDDLEEVKWFKLNEIDVNEIMPGHQILFKKFINYITNNK